MHNAQHEALIEALRGIRETLERIERRLPEEPRAQAVWVLGDPRTIPPGVTLHPEATP